MSFTDILIGFLTGFSKDAKRATAAMSSLADKLEAADRLLGEKLGLEEGNAVEYKPEESPVAVKNGRRR